MDIAEFVERFMDIELKDWQRDYIRMLEQSRHVANIRIGRNQQMYVYMNPKELISNGTPNHS